MFDSKTFSGLVRAAIEGSKRERRARRAGRILEVKLQRYMARLIDVRCCITTELDKNYCQSMTDKEDTAYGRV